MFTLDVCLQIFVVREFLKQVQPFSQVDISRLHKENVMKLYSYSSQRNGTSIFIKEYGFHEQFFHHNDVCFYEFSS